MTNNSGLAIRSTLSLGRFPRLRTDSWLVLGQDGGQSISLGEQTLFVFSDTLLASFEQMVGQDRVAAPFQMPLGSRGIFLANSAGIASPAKLSQALQEMRYYTDEEHYPREIITPTEEERAQKLRYWPEHGIYSNGKVYLYYLGIQTTDPTTIWGFRNVGTGLAVFDPQTGNCERIYHQGDWRLWRAEVADFHFGVQVIRDGDMLYVFGSIRDHFWNQAILARVPVTQITDPLAYQYLASPAPEWQADLSTTYRLGESSSDYSVSYNPYLQQYLMTYVDSYRKTLAFRTANQLWGPYSPPLAVAEVPYKSSSEMIYLGFEHPKFSDDEGRTIYISYCQPHFSGNMLIKLKFQ